MKIKQIIFILSAGIILSSASCKKDEEKKDSNKTTDISTDTSPDTKSFSYGSVSDIDGNQYRTIQIGTQTWMVDNLRTTSYKNGEKITYISSCNEWRSTTNGAYCNWNDTKDEETLKTYGSFYNWYSVNDPRGLAPEGWHIPTKQDWQTLTQFLGGENRAGGKMKESKCSHWQTPNFKATNEVGFRALPAGRREGTVINGDYNYRAQHAYYWSSQESCAKSAWNVYISYNFDYCMIGNPEKTYGLSVRCVKNN